MYVYNGILLIHEKEGNSATCNNSDETGGHYTKWNKPDRKTNTVWYHLYVESKNK